MVGATAKCGQYISGVRRVRGGGLPPDTLTPPHQPPHGEWHRERHGDEGGGSGAVEGAVSLWPRAERSGGSAPGAGRRGWPCGTPLRWMGAGEDAVGDGI